MFKIEVASLINSSLSLSLFGSIGLFGVGSKSLADSNWNKANWNDNEGSEDFLAFCLYNSKVLLWDNKDACIPLYILLLITNE